MGVRSKSVIERIAFFQVTPLAALISDENEGNPRHNNAIHHEPDPWDSV
jgi:hypothetical protein